MAKTTRILTIFIVAFMLVLSTAIVLADSDENETGRDRSEDSDNDSEDLNEDIEVEIEIEEDEESDLTSMDKERTRARIHIEREITYENGKRIEVIKRKIITEDGREIEIKIKIENRTEDGKYRERFRYEIEGQDFEIDTEEGMDLEEESNGTEYKIKARLRDGTQKELKIMPDVASEVAIERLKALNFSIQLRERIHNNTPKVVYNMEANQSGRFLGIFKMQMKLGAEVDAETGELLEARVPWWAFLVSSTEETEEPLLGESCGTVTPGENDACCQNKGFDYWNSTTEECENNATQ